MSKKRRAGPSLVMHPSPPMSQGTTMFGIPGYLLFRLRLKTGEEGSKPTLDDGIDCSTDLFGGMVFDGGRNGFTFALA